jgi:hypothetical protein
MVKRMARGSGFWDELSKRPREFCALPIERESPVHTDVARRDKEYYWRNAFARAG